MKFTRSLLSAVVVGILAFEGSNAMAESTYGYNAAGTGPVTATARLNVTVNVPLLILLRVGSAALPVDTLTFNATVSGGIPGGPAALTAGSNQAATWNGTAPTFVATAATNSVTAFGWTNSTGGGRVTCAVTTPFTGSLTGASVTVASTPIANGGLAHPGADTACGAGPQTTFARNTLVSSTWTYSVSAAGLTAATPGANTETVTYTATTL